MVGTHLQFHPFRPVGVRPPAARHLCSSGAGLTEFIVVAPLLLFSMLMLLQLSMLFHGKSQLNYASFEAARAGSAQHAQPEAMRHAFARAMTGYHGGGRNSVELAASHARALLENAHARIEILSPTRASFDDYHSPALAARMQLRGRVIPNANLAFLRCPSDRPECRSDPVSNASRQTLADANLLKLRITYGIPPRKQIPLAGSFLATALATLNADDSDSFRRQLLAQGRIPIVSHIVMRMQSAAIESEYHSTSAASSDSSSSPGNSDQDHTEPDSTECTLDQLACSPDGTPASGTQPDENSSSAVACDPLLDPGCSSSDASCAAPADWAAEDQMNGG